MRLFEPETRKMPSVWVPEGEVGGVSRTGREWWVRREGDERAAAYLLP